jgi:hypothetical protein
LRSGLARQKHDALHPLVRTQSTDFGIRTVVDTRAVTDSESLDGVVTVVMVVTVK